ncbi:MAG: hypothetical protein HZA53_17000 [Planctomycetes bacterium]|nr:hypothetical protein [Planctomycetota bacterium]
MNPLLALSFVFLPQGSTNPTPLVELQAAYPWGEQLSAETTPDGRRAFVAPGAGISVLDTSALAFPNQPVPLVQRIETPDCAAVAMAYFRGPGANQHQLFLAGGTGGLWRVGLCPELFQSPPVLCASPSIARVAFVGDAHVQKRCVDVAVIANQPLALGPLVFGLFAARADSAAGPSELLAYRVLSDGSTPLYARFVFGAGMVPVSAAATALAVDPFDPNSLYVAMGTGGIFKLGIATVPFTAVALTVPPCPLSACPAGESVRDLCVARPSILAGSLFAALEYGRVVEYALAGPGIGLPVVHPVPCGYPEKLAAFGDPAGRLLLAVATKAAPSIEVDTAAPYRITGIWSNLCVRPGVQDPNGPQPPGCEEVQLLQRTTLASGLPLTVAARIPVAGDWGSVLLERPANSNVPRFLTASSRAGFEVRRITSLGTLGHAETATVIERIGVHIDLGFAAVDGFASELNPALFSFGLDPAGATLYETGMLQAPLQPPFDVLPVPGTERLCTSSALGASACPDAPNPYVGGLLGGAHWVDPLDPSREVFLPGRATWIRVDGQCKPIDAHCSKPCGGRAPALWKQDYLDPSDPSALGWQLVSLRPGNGAVEREGLDLHWWQLACPSQFDPLKSETTDYIHSYWSSELSDVVLVSRAGSEFGFKLLSRANLAVLSALTCSPLLRGIGERLPPPPALAYLEARTHYERESPGTDDQGNELDPCNVNALCSPTPNFFRNLFNNRTHTFRARNPAGAARVVAAVVAGYVATGPSTQFVVQPPSCQWDSYYGKGMLVFYDVTDTLASFAPPTLLRIALGPGPIVPGDSTEGHFWAVETRTYGSGTAERTMAFAADLLGRMVVFDVSTDRLWPAARTPYLPDPSTGLPATPLLAPHAAVDFPIDAVDGLRQSCVDLVLDRNFVYCAVGRAGVGVVDVTNPAQPQVVMMLDTPGLALGVALRRLANGTEQLLVGDSRCGLRVYGAPTASTD